MSNELMQIHDMLCDVISGILFQPVWDYDAFLSDSVDLVFGIRRTDISKLDIAYQLIYDLTYHLPLTNGTRESDDILARKAGLEGMIISCAKRENHLLSRVENE